MSGWQPTDGEIIEGVIVALDFATSKQDGEPYPLVVLRLDDDREVTVHGHHRVLRDELAKRAPNEGDRLKITYLGKVTPDGGGRAYAAYRVQGGSNPFTWNMFRDPDDQLPPEHATGQAAIPAAAPAAPRQPVDTTDRIDPADEVAIRRLLEAVGDTRPDDVQRWIATLNERAGGPWAEHCTAEQGAQALGWLARKAAAWVDVDAVLAAEVTR